MTAVGYTSGDPRKADITGDDSISVSIPGAAVGVSSLGRYTIKLGSSFVGNENTSDSTGRLLLESYQKAQLNNAAGTAYAHYGEVIRIFSRKHNSKQMIAWYGPKTYDVNGDPSTPDTAWFWMGAHYDPNDPGAVHGHWSIETPDSAALLQTRMEFLIWDPDSGTFGMNKTKIVTHDADFVIEQSNGALHLAGVAATTVNQYFNRDTKGRDAGKRWNIQMDSTAEGGSNAGSDLRINSHTDAGAFLASIVTIRRNNGVVGVGITNPTSIAAKLDVSEAGSRHTVQSTQTTATGGNLFANYSAISGNIGNRFFDGRVSGDTSGRLVIFADGKHEWGDGTTRDTNLYRSAANVLKTDDKLITAVGLGVGNSASATSLGTLSKKMEVFDASGASLGFVPIYTTIS